MAQGVDVGTMELDTDNDLDEKQENENDDGLVAKGNSEEEEDEWGDDNEEDEEGDWGDVNDFKTFDDNTMPLRPMSEKEKQEKHSKHTDFWICGKCSFKNNVWRAVCMSCYSPNGDVIAALFNQNIDKKNKKDNKNDLKSNKKNKNNNKNGSFAYNVMNIKVKHGPKSGIAKELPKCKQCNAYIIEDVRSWHNELCAPVPTEIAWNDKWYLPLTIVQMEAIHKIMKESIEESEKAKEILQSKAEKLSYTNDELKQVINFMQWHVPITVRIPKEIITKYLIKDPFLRNLFETGQGKGGNDQVSRKQWETRMFGESYNKGSACERPKYGCLNVSMKKEGCTAAGGYGDCYFVMKDMTCRWRTTLTDQDSMNANCKIGTLSHCCHVLNAFADANFTDLIETSKSFYKEQAKKNGLYFDEKNNIDIDDTDTTNDINNENDATKKKVTNGYQSGGHYDAYFREVQIHGDVRCDTDIEELWIPKVYKNDAKLIEFINNNGIKLKIIDE